ncbi:MAG: PspC domain-containing protein [Sphingomicrobium sp.]
MPNRQPNLFFRKDTMLGVCQGLGEEFGFNPIWLRLALAFGVLWNPPAVVGIYLALGAVFAAARWLYPVPAAEALAPALPQLAAEQVPAEAAAAAEDAEPRRLAA